MNEKGENEIENGFFRSEKSRLCIPSKNRGPGNTDDWVMWKLFCSDRSMGLWKDKTVITYSFLSILKKNNYGEIIYDKNTV